MLPLLNVQFSLSFSGVFASFSMFIPPRSRAAWFIGKWKQAEIHAKQRAQLKRQRAAEIARMDLPVPLRLHEALDKIEVIEKKLEDTEKTLKELKKNIIRKLFTLDLEDDEDQMSKSINLYTERTI